MPWFPRLNAQFQSLKEVQVFSFQPAMIPGYGMGNSLELNLRDMTGGDLATFYEAAIQFLGALNQRPEVAMAYTSYAINFPQISVEVDAAKCKRAGISPSAVLDAVGSYCGGAYISNYNQYGKSISCDDAGFTEYRPRRTGIEQYVCTQWHGDGSGKPVRNAGSKCWDRKLPTVSIFTAPSPPM